MTTVLYETENGIFEFNHEDVLERLRYYAQNIHVEEAIELLSILSPPMGEKIRIPGEFYFIEHIIFELLKNEVGSVACKQCKETYRPRNLKTIISRGETGDETGDDIRHKNNHCTEGEIEGQIRHGENRIDAQLPRKSEKAGDRLTKREKSSPMQGGKGYTCPHDHALILRVNS